MICRGSNSGLRSWPGGRFIVFRLIDTRFWSVGWFERGYGVWGVKLFIFILFFPIFRFRFAKGTAPHFKNISQVAGGACILCSRDGPQPDVSYWFWPYVSSRTAVSDAYRTWSSMCSLFAACRLKQEKIDKFEKFPCRAASIHFVGEKFAHQITLYAKNSAAFFKCTCSGLRLAF